MIVGMRTRYIENNFDNQNKIFLLKNKNKGRRKAWWLPHLKKSLTTLCRLLQRPEYLAQ